MRLGFDERVGQVASATYIKFHVGTRQMGLYRAYRNTELIGELCIAPTRRGQDGDLLFASGQSVHDTRIECPGALRTLTATCERTRPFCRDKRGPHVTCASMRTSGKVGDICGVQNVPEAFRMRDSPCRAHQRWRR